MNSYREILAGIDFDILRLWQGQNSAQNGMACDPVGSIGRSGSPLHQNIPNLWWWQWWLKHVQNMESWWKLWKTHGQRRWNTYFCPANVPWIHWWPATPGHTLARSCSTSQRWDDLSQPGMLSPPEMAKVPSGPITPENFSGLQNNHI